MPYNPYEQALQGLGAQTFTQRPRSPRFLADPDTLLSGGPEGPGNIEHDPASAAYIGKTDLRSELEGRLFNAQRGGDVNTAAALKGLIGSTEQDITENPVAQDIAARRAGFSNVGPSGPAEQAAIYHRAEEAAKTRMPLDVAKATAAGGLAEAEVKARSAREVAELGAKPYDKLFGLLGGGGGVGQGLNPGDTLSIAGVGSAHRGMPVKPQVAISPTTGSQIGKAREEEFNARGYFGGVNEAKKAHLDQLISTAISNSPASQHAKLFVQQAIAHPKLSKLSLDDILTATGETDLTQEEKDELQLLLNSVRGY